MDYNVVEIPYDKYKKFCSYLSCKDVFYYIKTLFVTFGFDETIYAVKFPTEEDPKVVFESLKSNNQIIEYNILEFENGIPIINKELEIKEEMFKDKNILVRC